MDTKQLLGIISFLLQEVDDENDVFLEILRSFGYYFNFFFLVYQSFYSVSFEKWETQK